MWLIAVRAATTVLDATKVIHLFATYCSSTPVGGGERDVASFALEVAGGAEYFERKGAGPASEGRESYTETVLRGLVQWAESADDRNVVWRLQSQLGRYLEKVGRASEGRTIYEALVAEGGLDDLAVERLSLMLERGRATFRTCGNRR
jgi:hypothetical protein